MGTLHRLPLAAKEKYVSIYFQLYHYFYKWGAVYFEAVSTYVGRVIRGWLVLSSASRRSHHFTGSFSYACIWNNPAYRICLGEYADTSICYLSRCREHAFVVAAVDSIVRCHTQVPHADGKVSEGSKDVNSYRLISSHRSFLWTVVSKRKKKKKRCLFVFLTKQRLRWSKSDAHCTVIDLPTELVLTERKG